MSQQYNENHQHSIILLVVVVRGGTFMLQLFVLLCICCARTTTLPLLLSSLFYPSKERQARNYAHKRNARRCRDLGGPSAQGINIVSLFHIHVAVAGFTFKRNAFSRVFFLLQSHHHHGSNKKTKTEQLCLVESPNPSPPICRGSRIFNFIWILIPHKVFASGLYIILILQQ